MKKNLSRCQKIKLYIGRQGKATGARENPWVGWMKKFRMPSGPAPKKLADYQFYMQHEDFRTKVTEEFNKQSVGLKASQHLKVRTGIAKELLLAEPQEVQARIKEEAEEEHAEVVSKHEDQVDGLPSLDEDEMAECVCPEHEIVHTNACVGLDCVSPISWDPCSMA
jgi:hypothetical protein